MVGERRNRPSRNRRSNEELMSKALIVDDDVQVLSFVKQLMETAGYEVLSASTFAQAREYIQGHDLAILVADVRLGDFNGIQLGILAKNSRPNVRIVIMSGWDDPVLRHEADQLGAAYVQKPFSAEQLRSALK
jgi:DNA-binding response OmpR family regulator